MDTGSKPVVLTDALIAAWHPALLGNKPEREYLHERCISQSIMEEFGLGYDGRRITIPVRDKDGVLVNVRRYKRDPRPGEDKILNTKGHGSPTRLNFLSSLGKVGTADHWGDWIIIAGGEFDALSAIGEGMPALCSTNGEGAVARAEDLELLRGLKVAVILDNDAAGRAAATKWCAALQGIAAQVRNVTLPREGMDLNDWYTDDTSGGSFHLLKLMEAAPGFGERRSVEDLLALAMSHLATEGSRNQAGFYLACQMRDERYSADEAWELALRPFHSAVATLKKPDYEETEARESIVQAYAAPARSAVGGKAVAHSYPLTEFGNAERMVTRHGDSMRFVPPFGKWLIWDARRWAEDELGQMMVWAKQTARIIGHEARGLPEEDERRKRQLSWATTSESSAKLEATLKLARSEPQMSMLPAKFDTNPMLLNCHNGVLDLTTGVLQSHRREDFCRRMIDVSYDPAADAPTFQDFLKRVQPDPEVRAFLQRAVGYSLTGQTSEQKLLLLHGTGANGKSTLIELIHDLLGEYATLLPAEALVQTNNDRIPNDIARLDGARFVSVMEFEDSGRLNERLVKQLTGGDTMTARFMRGEFFDFRPQCTLWVSSNHRPVITGSDDGIWRRFLLVDFPVKIPKHEIDPTLHQRIRDTELPGLLRWAVEGALAWQKVGLNPPASVLVATESYRADSDLLGDFLDENCTVGFGRSVAKADLYETYKTWCDTGRLKAATKISFGRMLKERADLDITEDRTGKLKVHIWQGLDLLDRHTERRNGPHIRLVESVSEAAAQIDPDPSASPATVKAARRARQ